MTLDLLSFLAPRHHVAFVGHSAPDGLPDGVEHLQTPPARRRIRASAPLEFRRNASALLRAARPKTAISLGAVAPPTDVCWVHSVHRAWLRMAKSIPVGRFSVPPQTRYLMPRHRVMLAMEREYFVNSDPKAIICTSSQELDDLIELYNVDVSKALVVPDPYDPMFFNLGRRFAHRDEARAALGVREQEIAVFFVGNEFHRKGFKQLLEALAAVRDARVSLHVIGRKPPSSYEGMIERLGLRETVHYHGAVSDLGWWYAGADLLVLPTQYEPFGLVIVEALASGVPVITTSRAGASPAIAHGKTGLIQNDPYDVGELAMLIEAAMEADLESWGTEAAGSVSAFERDTVMARVEHVLLS
jgi:glycosyltransferase involved in cell wall biosynthesis